MKKLNKRTVFFGSLALIFTFAMIFFVASATKFGSKSNGFVSDLNIHKALAQAQMQRGGGTTLVDPDGDAEQDDADSGSDGGELQASQGDELGGGTTNGISMQTLGGYGWSETVGWISFSGNTSGGGTYEVNVAASGSGQDSRLVSGYAWSPNIGWIKFGGLSNFPTGSGTSATDVQYDGNQFTGWARVCGGMDDSVTPPPDQTTANNSCSGVSRKDGWDGWISMAGTATNGNPYSVSVTGTAVPSLPGATYLTGYMWGSDVVGWIDMSQAYLGPGDVTDECPNIDGVQQTVPPGYVKDPNTGNCVTTPNSTPNPQPIAGAGCSYDVIVTWNVETDTSYVLKRGSTIIYQGTGGQGTETGLTPGQTYTYDLTATNAAGSVTRSAGVTLPATCPPNSQPPQIGGFVTVPSTVSAGGSCALTWSGIQNINLPGGDTCTITGPNYSYNLSSTNDGSTPTPPINASSRYTLTCRNAAGSVSKQASCNLKSTFIEF